MSRWSKNSWKCNLSSPKQKVRNKIDYQNNRLCVFKGEHQQRQSILKEKFYSNASHNTFNTRKKEYKVKGPLFWSKRNIYFYRYIQFRVPKIFSCSKSFESLIAIMNFFFSIVNHIPYFFKRLSPSNKLKLIFFGRFSPSILFFGSELILTYSML